jgi:thiosulfate/3-mercaptopyruvate sulfurtransferase
VTTNAHSDPLVSAQWLNAHLKEVVVLDATYFMPADPARSQLAFTEKHIPGARLFEIDEIADKSTGLPHMMPAAADFAKAVGELGIGDSDRVVVYDRSANHFSAPRVWQTFRAFGHEAVHVLDGGLDAWEKSGFPIEQGISSAALKSYRVLAPRPEGVMSLAGLRGLIADQGPAQIVDARSAGRFEGTAPEPRAGLRGGHMPRARNVPFDRLTGADGRFLSPDAIATLFADAGVGPGGPVVASCGSGLTACVLALGLARIGQNDVAIYDGSWTQWGGLADTPIVTGRAGEDIPTGQES